MQGMKKKAILVTVLALCKANIFLYHFSVSHYRVIGVAAAAQPSKVTLVGYSCRVLLS